MFERSAGGFALIITKTSTGKMSSAEAVVLPEERIIRFSIVSQHRVIHAFKRDIKFKKFLSTTILSLGDLYALIMASSACAEGHGHSA
jgi:hypothetical protein